MRILKGKAPCTWFALLIDVGVNLHDFCHLEDVTLTAIEALVPKVSCLLAPRGQSHLKNLPSSFGCEI